MITGIALFHIKTSFCLIYFVHDCVWKNFSGTKLPQNPSKLIFGTILVTIRVFAHFQLQIRETKQQKRSSFCLNWITT